MRFNTKENKNVLSNFSYLAVLELFGLLAPLITYPYLVRVLGTELYGWVITAQVTSSYASILVDFGFRRVSAKYVASSKDNHYELSKIVSTVICLRMMLWVIAFVVYLCIVSAIGLYREKLLLFILSYGMTIPSALLPDFYFQGIEKMRYITIINVVIRLIFIGLTFVCIKTPNHYLYVPVLWSIGYFIGGVYSLYVVFVKHNVTIIRPALNDYKFHLRETTPIFLSDVMLNVKDKVAYNIMGGLLGMSDVVVYDIGTKIVNLLAKPTQILSSAIFPSMSRDPDVKKTKRIMLLLFIVSVILVGFTYLFLPYIVKFFIDEDVDLMPLGIYLLVPIFTGISYYIPSCVFVVFGRNRYVLYSTIFSTFSFGVALVIMWCLGMLNSVMSFIILTVFSFFIEMVYRLFLTGKIFRNVIG